MIKNTKQFWTWWTQELKTWFTNKFSPLATQSNVNTKAGEISAAISGVDTKATAIKTETDKIQSIKTETNKIQSIKDKTDKIGNANDDRNQASVFGKIADVKYTFTSWVSGAWTTFYSSWTTFLTNYAKKADVTSAQNTIMGKLNDSSHGLQKIKQAVDAIPTGQITGYAKEEQVKDGNDTAISVAKQIRTETNKIGTPTDATNNTLFKAIENGGIKPEQYNAIAKETTLEDVQGTLEEVQESLDNEATEQEIYQMFDGATDGEGGIYIQSSVVEGGLYTQGTVVNGSLIL